MLCAAEGVFLILLDRYLDKLPKSFISQLYRHFFPHQKGVVTNSQILDAIREELFSDSYLQERFAAMTTLQKRLLAAIYGSSERGVLQQELLLSLPDTERFLLGETVEEFRRSLLIARSDNGRLYGLIDLWPDLSDLFAAELPPQSHPELPTLSLEGFAQQHLLHLFALVRREKWQLTRSGHLCRRDAVQFAEELQFLGQLGDEAIQQELELLLELAFHFHWIVATEEQLFLTSEAEAVAALPLHELQGVLLAGWLELRQQNAPGLRWLLAMLTTPRSALGWSEFFWVFDGVRNPQFSGKGRPKWEVLPLLVRELALLGMLQMTIQRDQSVVALALTSAAQSWSASSRFAPLPEQKGFATPDFEVLLPSSTAGPHAWTLHQIAELHSDDRLMKFKLRRETLLKSLNGGLQPAQIRAVAEWLQLPDLPYRQLQEWLWSYEQSRFSHHLLLEMRSDELRRQLLTIPLAAEAIVEELPGYGFILKEGGHLQLLPILEEFGLFPPPWPRQQNSAPYSPPPERHSSLSLLEFDSGWTAPPAGEQIQLGELSPAAQHFRELDLSQRLRLIRYTIAQKKMVLVNLKPLENQKRRSAKLIPQQLEEGTAPRITGMGSGGVEIKVSLDEILNLRLPS